MASRSNEWCQRVSCLSLNSGRVVPSSLSSALVEAVPASTCATVPVVVTKSPVARSPLSVPCTDDTATGAAATADSTAGVRKRS